MTTDLIQVTQLPIITERLQAFKDTWAIAAAEAKEMACTEETLVAVKSARADLRKAYDVLEQQRKAVKAAIIEPYDAFELVYKECVTDVFRDADATLKQSIDDVETAQKQEKADAVRRYYEEYCQSIGLDWLPFERLYLNVTKSVSEKKLKEQAKSFADQIVSECAMIATLEHTDEIMVEYKQSLNAADAICTVADRHAALEREKQRAEEDRLAAEAREQAAETVEQVLAEQAQEAALAPPTVQEKAPKIYKITFTVTGTKEQLHELKEYLETRGIQYE